MRIFLDANILFSAAKTNGAIRQLLRLIAERGHQAWVDEFVLAEARRNLALKDTSKLQAFEEIVPTLHVSPHPSVARASAEFDWLPEKDRPVLATAIRARCEVLLTGDRTHFGIGYGKTYGGVTIGSPRLLAEVLLDLKS